VGVVGASAAVRRCTKEMRGRARGAGGGLEGVFSLLRRLRDFSTPSINGENLDPAVSAGEIARGLVENAGLDSVMTNSFGFGGTNGSMILSRYLD